MENRPVLVPRLEAASTSRCSSSPAAPAPTSAFRKAFRALAAAAAFLCPLLQAAPASALINGATIDPRTNITIASMTVRPTPALSASLASVFSSSGALVIRSTSPTSGYKPFIVYNQAGAEILSITQGGILSPAPSASVNGQNVTVRSLSGEFITSTGPFVAVGTSTFYNTIGILASLGISTVSPQVPLDVQGSAAFGIGLDRSSFSNSGALTMGSNSLLSAAGGFSTTTGTINALYVTNAATFGSSVTVNGDLTMANPSVLSVSSMTVSGSLSINSGRLIVSSATAQFNGNEAAPQAIFSGWTSSSGVDPDNGEIQIGRTSTWRGHIGYDGKTTATMFYRNNYNSSTIGQGGHRFYTASSSELFGTHWNGTGINDTTPDARLEVVATLADNFVIQASSNNDVAMWYVDKGGNVVSRSSVTAGVLYQDNQLSCSTGLTSDASGGINGCVASDLRLKTDVKPLAYNPRAIDAYKPISWRWVKMPGKDDKSHIGFGAQDVEKVSPLAVVPAGNGYKGIDTNAMVAEVVLELQQLRRRVKTLEAKK